MKPLLGHRQDNGEEIVLLLLLLLLLLFTDNWGRIEEDVNAVITIAFCTEWFHFLVFLRTKHPTQVNNNKHLFVYLSICLSICTCLFVV